MKTNGGIEQLTSDWSEWQTLDLSPPPASETVLQEVLDGGQAFRWHRSGEPKQAGLSENPEIRNPNVERSGEPQRADSAPRWTGQWSNALAEVQCHPQGISWRAPAPVARQVAASIGSYLDASQDYNELVDRLPWRSDPHLALCLEEFRGLRLLRQPFGETLLGFLCSATKQIVQIKQMVGLLAFRFGEQVMTNDQCPMTNDGKPPSAVRPLASGNRPPSAVYRLPTWQRLVSIPEAELRGCLLGFRARYIHQTARFLAERPGWLEETERMPYPGAKARLCELPGVGEKVADCVLLFGAGRMAAFPVDVWIIKAMAQRYGLTGWKPGQIAHFGRAHFGELAGLAQQYLFAYERRKARLA